MQKTIYSIKNQTFKNYEVWIIDGGSNKESINYLDTLKSPIFYQSEKDNGIYNAMNKGVSLSLGEWIYFLGSGDVLHDDYVLENLFLKNYSEDNSIVYGNINYFSKNELVSVFNSKWNHLFWLKNTLHHQSAFYRRNLFTNRKFDENFKVLADYDFNLNLFKSRINSQKVNLKIANCNYKGISKNYNWNLYKEDYLLKVKNSHLVFFPFFYLLSLIKFLLKNKPTSN